MTGESPPPHPPPHPQANEQLDSLLSPENIIILPTPVSNAQLTPPHSAFDPSFPSISIDPSNLLLTSPYLPINDQSPPLSGSTSPLLSPSDSCPRRGSIPMSSFSDTASIQSSASSDNMHTQEQASLLSVPEVTPLYEKRKKGGPGLKRKGLSKEEKEARKNDRIVRNRLAAQESREKKRKYVETLESTAQSLRTENQVLTESNERLTKRVKRLEEENQSLNQKIEWLMHQVTEMKANQQSGNGNAGQGHGHGETQGQRQGQDFLLASSENNNGVNPTAPASSESNNAPLDGVLTLDEITQLLFGGFSKPAAFGYLSSSVTNSQQWKSPKASLYNPTSISTSAIPTIFLYQYLSSMMTLFFSHQIRGQSPQMMLLIYRIFCQFSRHEIGSRNLPSSNVKGLHLSFEELKNSLKLKKFQRMGSIHRWKKFSRRPP